MPTLPPRPPLRPSRRRLPRLHPIPYWLLATCVAGASGLAMTRLAGDAAAERARWGALRPTVVAVDDLPAGTVLGPSDLTVRQLPTAVVPTQALRTLPVDAITSAAIHAGEPVVPDRLGPPGASPVAALLPADTRGVAVPMTAGLPLEVGDVVDVLATFEPDAAGDDPTFAVAEDATVVHVGDDAVTVAVADHDTSRLAYALATAVLTIVLSGGG